MATTHVSWSRQKRISSLTTLPRAGGNALARLAWYCLQTNGPTWSESNKYHSVYRQLGLVCAWLASFFLWPVPPHTYRTPLPHSRNEDGSFHSRAFWLSAILQSIASYTTTPPHTIIGQTTAPSSTWQCRLAMRRTTHSTIIDGVKSGKRGNPALRISFRRVYATWRCVSIFHYHPSRSLPSKHCRSDRSFGEQVILCAIAPALGLFRAAQLHETPSRVSKQLLTAPNVRVPPEIAGVANKISSARSRPASCIPDGTRKSV